MTKRHFMVILGSAVVALSLTAPASADPPSDRPGAPSIEAPVPDAFERAVARQQPRTAPDAFERAAQRHLDELGTSAVATHPDNLARVVRPGPLSVGVPGTPISASAAGFDWTDALAGAATGAVVVLVGGIGLLGLRGRRVAHP